MSMLSQCWNEGCSDEAYYPHLSLDCYFDNYTLVQMNLLPLVVTMLAAPDANVQLLHNCMPEITRLLEPVRISVQHTVMHANTHDA
jgi:hypothetical protein